jgi:hypothetical protein
LWSGEGLKKACLPLKIGRGWLKVHEMNGPGDAPNSIVISGLRIGCCGRMRLLIETGELDLPKA